MTFPVFGIEVNPHDSYRQTIAGRHIVVVGTPCRTCGGGPLNHPGSYTSYGQRINRSCDCSRCFDYDPLPLSPEIL